MQSKSGDYIPVAEKDLKPHAQRANVLMNKVSFRSNKPPSVKPVAASDPTKLRESSIGTTQEDSHSFLTIAKAISGDPLVLTDVANHVVTTIRDGITIAYHLAGQYFASSGLEELTALNRAGRLSSVQHPEFQAKNATSAAVATFTLASYVVWKLSSYESEKVGLVKMPEAETPETYLVNYINAIDCSLYNLCNHIANGGLVQTDIQLVKATILYFEAVIKEIKFKEKSFAFPEFFTEVRYRLIDSEFSVRGFEDQSTEAIVTNEFNRLKFAEIIGNGLAKHEAKRTAQRLVCFDTVHKKNPFMVIGGLSLARLGYGFPGTGKSMQIAATATLIEEYCKQIGLPFVFSPMPKTIVSEFQGKSAERMSAWMALAHRTNSVNYMPIDDAENKFQNRSEQGVSEGVKDVISVFLTETEGASAPHFGNSVIELFTNLPEKLDPAVLSRIVSRFSIDGATTWEDFLDQDHLWIRGLGDDAEFVGMIDPSGYKYLANQASVTSVGKLHAPISEVTEEHLKLALEAADKAYGRKDHGFFAKLFFEVKKYYKMFTSRDVRNIQQAINVRITDFDLPDEWFEHPDKGFFTESFDRKVSMLKELRRGCMQGIDFSDVRFEETMRYLSTLTAIANVEKERRINALIESLDIEETARIRRRSMLSGQV